jgi:dihydrofolate reductase
MAKLIYSSIGSVDGYIADEQGNFEWAAPDEELHSVVNDLERPVGTHLLGRRMYEVLRYWETADVEPEVSRDFADLWRSTDKIVYSKTLDAVSTARTSIERDFDPEKVRRMKATTERDMTVGGPELAAQAFRAGLVDECHLFLTPIVVGGGTRSLPDQLLLELDLVDVRRFGSGVVHLHYRPRTPGGAQR